MKYFSKLNSSFFWDLLFISSILCIWPRFIEPFLLSISRIRVSTPNVHPLRILQISDLHFHEDIPERFLKKIIRKVDSEKPDLIVFTGDFICRSQVKDSLRLKQFLSSLTAPHGCFAVLGNHDYSDYVSINKAGDYDVYNKANSQLTRGFKRFFKKITLTAKSTAKAKSLVPHTELVELLEECGIVVLENASKTIQINGQTINIVGLGEHMLDRANPEQAFSSCDPHLPTIVLVHNPDGIPKLSSYPGHLILSGHTHGGQINLPLIWDKICLLENPSFKRGLFQRNGKWIYVSRGVGGSTPFRLFSVPEITLFHLQATS